MKIRVGISRTVNIGNYESVRPMVEVEDEALEGEDSHQLYVRVREDAECFFKKELHMQVKEATESR